MNCMTYGGLYTYSEVFSYRLCKDSIEKSQGICPPGWHVPSDYEWRVLVAYVDSKYKDPDDWEWRQMRKPTDLFDRRGKDAGTKLRSKYGWIDLDHQTDPYGFSALSAGRTAYDQLYLKTYQGIGREAYFWTSTCAIVPPKEGHLYYFSWSITGNIVVGVERNGTRPGEKFIHSYSVRCIKDD